MVTCSNAAPHDGSSVGDKPFRLNMREKRKKGIKGKKGEHVRKTGEDT